MPRPLGDKDTLLKLKKLNQLPLSRKAYLFKENDQIYTLFFEGKDIRIFKEIKNEQLSKPS